jgi:hypothetical protein
MPSSIADSDGLVGLKARLCSSFVLDHQETRVDNPRFMLDTIDFIRMALLEVEWVDSTPEFLENPGNRW